ncbi:MAG: transposase [Candidatus Micrarchaeaceae archaeon]
MATSKNKIVEVLATAGIVAKSHGHTGKYAKHYIALSIKQSKGGISDRELADFLMTDEIGRILGYKRKFSYTIFPKVMSKPDTDQIMKEIYTILISDVMRGRQVTLLAQDSTDISAYSKKDKDARYGHRTPSKKEQIATKSTEKSFVFGYKLHVDANAETEIPLAVEVAPANRHDKVFFHRLYDRVKALFRMGFGAKFLADAAYDATDVYQELHYDNVKAVIAINGRGFYRSKIPKDKDYGKRWAVERIFSRLKELFGLAKNRFISIKKVAVHVFACLIAYWMRYA